MKMRDAGRKVMIHPMIDGPAMPKEEVVFQNLRFNADQLPELSDWKVGEEYMIVLTVKQMEHELEERHGEEEEVARFEVLKVGSYEDAEHEAAKLAQKKLGVR